MLRIPFRVIFIALGVCSALPCAAADSLYVAADHLILKVAENLGVTVFARGYQTPEQLVFNPRDSRLYVADAGANLVQAITLTGSYSNFATGLSGPDGLAVDRAGNLYVSNPGTGSRANTISRITSSGAIGTFATGLTGPGGMAFDSLGNLYVTQSNDTVAKVTPGGGVSTFASVSGLPVGIAIDDADNLYVTEGPRVTRITPAGAASTFATGFTATPKWLTFDTAGDLFVTAADGIDRVSASGAVTKRIVTDIGSTSGIAAVLQTWTWVGGVGNWSAAAKWNPAQAPSSSLAHVFVDGGKAAASAVTLDQNATVATLDVDAGDSLSIAAGRVLTVVGTKTSTFDGALNNAGTLAMTGTAVSGPRVKLLGGGTHTGVFAVNGSTVLDFAGGAYAMSAGASFSGNGFVNLSGGTVDFAGPLAVTGGLTVTMMGGMLAAPSIHVTGGGKLDFVGGGIAPTDLTIDGGGRVHIYLDTGFVLVTTGISIADGQLDLADSRMVVRHGDVSAVSGMIRSGAITSSDPTTGGLMLAAAPAAGAGTFGGVPVDAGDVLVGFAASGDADLDGRVDFNDLVRLAQNYNTTDKFWYQGDFTGDGAVDFNDLVKLAQSYNGLLSAGAVPGASAAFEADLSSAAFASVPEPAWGLAAVGVIPLRTRRRPLVGR
jgi:sugar lactone lactonase YvrE